jgi:pyrroline-5-carboxylate reductase
MKKIVFIGSGTMGTALATAACRTIDPKEVVVTDAVKEKGKALAEKLGCEYVATNGEAVESAEYVVFCVKPQFLMNVLEEVKPNFAECDKRGEKKVIVTIVAGVERQTYIDVLELSTKKVSVIRILPNTACLIGKGFILMEEGNTYTEEEVDEFKEIMKGAGGFDSLPAKQFTAGCVLTSTAPAFIAMFANSLADGGVYNGLLRPQARRYALEGIRGTVELLLQSDKHLEGLKDDVCSPSGPAMYGVKTLEDRGFRSSVINAVIDGYNRFAEIGKVK